MAERSKSLSRRCRRQKCWKVRCAFTVRFWDNFFSFFSALCRIEVVLSGLTLNEALGSFYSFAELSPKFSSFCRSFSVFKCTGVEVWVTLVVCQMRRDDWLLSALDRLRSNVGLARGTTLHQFRVERATPATTPSPRIRVVRKAKKCIYFTQKLDLDWSGSGLGCRIGSGMG